MVLAGCQTTTSQQASPKLGAADYNLRLGLAYLKQGDRERALHKLLLALKQAPRNTVAIDAMAFYLNATGQTERAQQYHRKALRIAPRRGRVLNNYGVFLCQHGHYAEAVEQFTKATADLQYLEAPEAFENAGLCALKGQKPAQAMDFFKAAVARDGQRVTSLLQLAELFYTQRRYEQSAVYLARYHAQGGRSAAAQQLRQKLAHKPTAKRAAQRGAA